MNIRNEITGFIITILVKIIGRNGASLILKDIVYNISAGVNKKNRLYYGQLPKEYSYLNFGMIASMGDGFMKIDVLRSSPLILQDGMASPIHGALELLW